MAERVILSIGTRKGLFVAEAAKSRGNFALRVGLRFPLCGGWALAVARGHGHEPSIVPANISRRVPAPKRGGVGGPLAVAHSSANAPPAPGFVRRRPVPRGFTPR